MRIYENCDDKYLQHLLWEAEETEDGRFIKAIRAEIKRRNRDE